MPSAAWSSTRRPTRRHARTPSQKHYCYVSEVRKRTFPSPLRGGGGGGGSVGEELLDGSTLTPTLSLSREREQVVSTSETEHYSRDIPGNRTETAPNRASGARAAATVSDSRHWAHSDRVL